MSAIADQPSHQAICNRCAKPAATCNAGLHRSTISPVFLNWLAVGRVQRRIPLGGRIMNMRTKFSRFHLMLALTVLIGGWMTHPVRADDDDSPGVVYTQSNAAAGNALVA